MRYKAIFGNFPESKYKATQSLQVFFTQPLHTNYVFTGKFLIGFCKFEKQELALSVFHLFVWSYQISSFVNDGNITKENCPKAGIFLAGITFEQLRLIKAKYICFLFVDPCKKTPNFELIFYCKNKSK